MTYRCICVARECHGYDMWLRDTVDMICYGTTGQLFTGSSKVKLP